MPNTPLTDAINALTTYANTVTGASDTTLSDAVATLASGYGGGGGTLPRLLNFETVTPTENASSSNKIQLNFTAVGSGRYVFLLSVATPQTPDAVLYKVLAYTSNNIGTTTQNATGILRPNGTRGTDTTIASYNPSTGLVQLGGTYGVYMAGETYYVFLFSLE